MNSEHFRLSNFTTRTLNVLATIFGNTPDARVILSDRTVHPVTVALGSRTIVLNPRLSGLYDLALGAALLQHRKLIKQGPSDTQRLDRWLTLKAQRVLVPAAHDELHARFGGISKLPGFFLPGKSLTALRLVDHCVEYEPLKPTGSGLNLHGGLSLHAIPELEITGADDDFNWVVESLENGTLPLESLPQLDDLPFVRIPLRIEAAQHFPQLEEWEKHLSDPDNRESIEALVKCHKDKTIVRDRRKRRGRLSFSGVHLDADRLTEARVRAQVGLPTPVFRTPASQLEPVFDPDQYLSILAFDMNDLQDLSWEGRRSAVLRYLAVLLSCHNEMGVHLIVLGAADRIVSLSNGRKVCLHFTSVLKSADESFEDVFLPRLSFLMQKKSAQWPGTVGSFHAVTAEDLRATFAKESAYGDFSYFALTWWARHLMNTQSQSFLQRSADHIDYVFREMEAELDGTLDTMGCFLPRELRQLGQHGEFLQSVTF